MEIYKKSKNVKTQINTFVVNSDSLKFNLFRFIKFILNNKL